MVFPEVREWIVLNWDKFGDPINFNRDLTEKWMYITQMRLENLLPKKRL